MKVAENYLREAEIKELNRIVGMFLDYAEDQAQRRKQVFLKDWPERLDAFLSFNERSRLAAEDQGAVDAMAALEDVARMAEQRSTGREDQP